MVNAMIDVGFDIKAQDGNNLFMTLRGDEKSQLIAFQKLQTVNPQKTPSDFSLRFCDKNCPVLWGF
jgi:hypothetical protein